MRQYRTGIDGSDADKCHVGLLVKFKLALL